MRLIIILLLLVSPLLAACDLPPSAGLDPPSCGPATCSGTLTVDDGVAQSFDNACNPQACSGLWLGPWWQPNTPDPTGAGHLEVSFITAADDYVLFVPVDLPRHRGNQFNNRPDDSLVLVGVLANGEDRTTAANGAPDDGAACVADMPDGTLRLHAGGWLHGDDGWHRITLDVTTEIVDAR